MNKTFSSVSATSADDFRDYKKSSDVDGYARIVSTIMHCPIPSFCCHPLWFWCLTMAFN